MQSVDQTVQFLLHSVAIIQLFFSLPAATTLIEALIISHQDCWKKLLLTNLFSPFHCTQHTTVRVTVLVVNSNHATPLLTNHPCLQIACRMKSQLYTCLFKVLHSSRFFWACSPTHIAQMGIPIAPEPASHSSTFLSLRNQFISPKTLFFPFHNPILLLCTSILCSAKFGRLLRLGLNSTSTERGTSSKNTNFTNLAASTFCFFQPCMILSSSGFALAYHCPSLKRH